MDNDDLLKDLDEDLALEIETEDAIEVSGVKDADVNGTAKSNALEEVKSLVNNYKIYQLSEGMPRSLANVAKVNKLRIKIIQLMDSSNDATVMVLSQLQPTIQQEIEIVHKILARLYAQRFPELNSLIVVPHLYSRIVEFFETSESKDINQLDGVLNREQVLVVSMAMQTGFNQEKQLSKADRELLFECINTIADLTDLQAKIRAFVSSRIDGVAPNLAALVGSEVAALLISAVGGLSELCAVPSCNLASVGKTKYLSHETGVDETGVRQKGYIYQCDLIQNQPIQIRKSAQRMLCAKVSLATRVDAAKQAENGFLGLKWRQEVISKLEKLQDPPNVTNTKPLPVPEDKPKKKRAGRRFRKYKQQFQLSHTRQLQNRMEFGKAEQSVMDTFGEEIGMGMAKSLQATQPTPQNNSAKLRKSMKRRLENDVERAASFTSSDARSDFLNTPLLEGPSDQPQKKLKPNKNDWYLKHIQK
ncbi:LAFE_0E08856g1_1 [Lachancea fermentati]|uniref:LAFE_0E08856g1_1 n=1 Tax=Lachancea fermentati TaxID=4955 RepID=A0A1G4MDC2_LACFM|nr:LAFE_0E08856g1_1 [Lachancea fermentati]